MLVSQRVSYVCFSCWNTHWERPWFGASLCFNAEDFHFMASLLAFASLSPRLRRWGLSIGPVHWGPLGGRMTCFPWLVSEESNRISPIVDDFAVEDGHVLQCWILPCFIGRVFRHISFGASPGHKMPDLHRFFFPFFPTTGAPGPGASWPPFPSSVFSAAPWLRRTCRVRPRIATIALRCWHRTWSERRRSWNISCRPPCSRTFGSDLDRILWAN